MKKLQFVFFFLIIFANYLYSEKNYLMVEYNGQNVKERIQLEEYEGIYYFNLQELNKTFNASIREDFSDNRLYVEMYKKQYIFLLNSSYFMFDNLSYNMIFSSFIDGERIYLPLEFLKGTLPLIDSKNFAYSAQNGILQATMPVDNRIRTIVIDPGHGGRDPGAIGFSKRNYEKDIVLSVALKLKEILESRTQINVLLTRNSDIFMPLQERTQFANTNNADLFVSLHCNASPRSSAHGIEVFFLSAARTDEARAVELLENSVVEIYEGQEALKHYDDLSFILMDMAQTEQLRESSYLAIKMQANLINRTNAYDRGVKQAGFYVLRGAFMPSVLVELGFLSNQQEERRLASEAYQKTLAQALFDGLMEYVKRYETIN